MSDHVETQSRSDETTVARLQHLNAALRAICDVSQLVTRAKSQDELLHGACKRLTATRGYYNAWIALLDDERRLIAAYSSGLGDAFEAMKARLRSGALTECGRRALECDGAIAIADPVSECRDCPLAPSYGGRAALTVRLSHQGRVYGLMSLSIPSRFAQDEQERSLIDEVASDLAYALHALEQTAARQRADAELRLRDRMIETIEHPMAIVDREFRYRVANPVYAELFGRRIEDIVGQRAADLLEAEAFEREVRPRLERALAGEQVFFEVWVEFPARGRRCMEMRYYPHRGDDGAIAGVISHGTDITERKQSEERLRESEWRYRTLAENFPDGALFLFDRDLRYVSCDGRGLADAGLKREDLIGKTIFEVWPEEMTRVFESHHRAVFEGRAGMYEVGYAGRIYENRVLPVIRADGTIREGIVITQEITQRKRGEQALRASEHRFRSFVENANDIVYALAADGRFIYISPNWHEYMGEPAAAAIGRSFEPYVHPEDVHLCRNFLNKVLHSGERQSSVEYRVRRADGEWRWHTSNGSPLRDEAGRAVSYVGIARDVTAQKRAQAEMQRYYKLFEAMIRQAPFAAHVIEPEADGARVLIENEESQRLLGARLEGELVETGRADALPCRFFTPDGEREVALHDTPGARAARGETVRNEEYLFRHVDGAEYHVMANAAPVRNEAGDPIAAVVSFHDITERVKTQRDKLDLESQLRQSQKLESVGRLAGGVAHDFNNLLTAILGNVELARLALETQPVDEGELIGNMQQIELAAERAANLTRQLLAFSRKQITQPQVLDLNQTIADLEKMLRRLLAEDIALAFAPGADAPAVRMDPSQIEQVVMNLVVNAGDAMPDGGRLTIETTAAALDAAYVERHGEVAPGRYACIIVSDTGCGMDAETQERIWEPFFTTKAVGRGTGLGLATVYGVVKQAGGHVRIYSEPGQGSTFRVYLPAYEGADACAEVAPRAAAPARGSETILLCEDDTAVRELTTQILRNAGYEVLAASRGRAALELARAESRPIALLITDVVMPDMSGRELADAVARGGHAAQTLFISGYTSNVIAHRGVLDEGVEFLEKPFSRETLLRRVRDILDRQSPPTEAS